MLLKAKLQWAIIKEKNAIKSSFYLISLCACIGAFLLYYPDYLINRTEPYMQHFPIDWLAVALIIGALALLIGIFVDSNWVRFGALLFLANVWVIFGVIAFLHHRGTGFPFIMWIYHFHTTALILLVLHGGVFND